MVQTKIKARVSLPVLAHVLVRNGLIKEGISSLLAWVWLNAPSLPVNLARNRAYQNPPWVLLSKPVCGVASSPCPCAHSGGVSIAAELGADTRGAGSAFHCCHWDAEPVGRARHGNAIFLVPAAKAFSRTFVASEVETKQHGGSSYVWKQK